MNRIGSPAALLAVLFFSGCGGDGPTEPPLEGLSISIVRGNSQFAPAGQLLPERLEVAVRSLDDEEAREGVVVAWEVVEGAGATVEDALVATDSAGIASTTARLGASLGTYRIRARLVDADGVEAEFEAFAVEPPNLATVPETASAGDTIEITGLNFSPTPAHNLVLFSGIRGAVVASTAETIRVVVPTCLPTGEVTVSVRFGSVDGGSRTMSVEAGTDRLDLSIGEDVMLTEVDGSACVLLAGSATSRRYLLVAQSAGAVAGAEYEFALRGIRNAPVAHVSAPGEHGRLRDVGDEEVGNPFRWHDRLRDRERVLLAARTVGSSVGSSTPRVAGPARVPQLGDRRTFSVLGADGRFVEVEARARAVGTRGVIFVDEAAAGLVSEALLDRLSSDFDEDVHDVVTTVFGEVTDLDENDRVVILMSPVVNAVTERGDPAFVAGFFFGLDLMPELENSNGGEVFYTVVPDPTGIHSDPRPSDLVLDLLPAVLAHELEHMVHFNERVLKRGATGTDALWLSEGLATMAEDRVALELDGPDRERFVRGNASRAARFLQSPGVVSLTVSSGSGTLEERGAGWLFVRYLWDHLGDDALGALTRTTVTGKANVEASTGRPWNQTFSDWAVAVQAQLETFGPLLQERHRFTSLSLPEYFALASISVEPEPPVPLQAEERIHPSTLPVGGTKIFRLEMTGTTPFALGFGSIEGGPLTPESLIQLRMVRIP